VAAIAAAERVNTEQCANAFGYALDAGAANVSSAALAAFKGRAFHVVRASLLARLAAEYSD
jgi:hypothetical protein